jgi:hypothetical protein
MKSITKTLWTGIALCIAAASFSTTASAGPNDFRAWVSNTGIDGQVSCYKAAPCRTFQFALKTLGYNQMGNEVVALTGGDFGPIDLSKGDQKFVTIDGGPSMATVTAPPGGAAIKVSIDDTGSIIFRNLRVKGDPAYAASSFSIGIQYLPTPYETFYANAGHPNYGSSQIILDNVVIEGFYRGVDVNLHSTNRLSTSDLTITDCFTAMSLQSTGGAMQMTMNRGHFHGSSIGLLAGNRTHAAIWNSDFSFTGNGNSSIAVWASDNGDGTEVDIDSTLISYASNIAVYATGAHTVVHVGNNMFINNGLAISPQSGARIFTFGNNYLTGNQNNGGATNTIGLM